MNEPIIIEELGKIWGRDAIFLDEIEFDGTHSVKLIGDFNGSLCESVENDKWISYELTFKGILEFKMTELDFFSNTEYTSSFEKVIGSDIINGFSKSSQNFKLKESHNHYVFHTYDDVIEIIACEFELKLKPKKE
ncbi:hypothetical protein G1J88_11910 [Tenacibaculum dicentrarchi]|uniref:hypothetical protein n=1 Tax=Tenacibaculum pacificus TaxID=3018314 RepID=UPI001BE56F10|nr:hypothetical protein [Tenacibaculum pacificus]MCD8416128.1 hypothetical protein [Tenacibaculum dicentrarchi]MCD8421246.1 hypothetical protein [Tenacibaculum dicentrarchi]MCG8829083.1 hypothetical protein [Tenacibaculum dicentrarchi]MCG8838996.1 hypothetical protein [Tenacibaculum dicentrarchi]WBX67946.1 hypothetical protein PG910_07360 [Tenacibaculum dicentrarchi]